MKSMDVTAEVIQLLGAVLGLGSRAASLNPQTPLLGAMPELDSMAALALITGITDHFGIHIHDDEIHADVFRTVGSLAEFVARKLGT